MKALSWSELNQWETDPEGHRRHYLEGEETPVTPEMNLGTIIHRTIQDARYPWLQEMVKAGYDWGKIRAVRSLLNLVYRPKESEVVLRAETRTGIPLIAVFDGLDRGARELDEYKTTTENHRWTQTRVDYSGQLSFYAYVWRLAAHSWFREIRLHRLNTKTGRSATLRTARGPLDIDSIANRIARCHGDLVRNGLWDKRLTLKERGKALNQTMNL